MFELPARFWPSQTLKASLNVGIGLATIISAFFAGSASAETNRLSGLNASLVAQNQPSAIPSQIYPNPVTPREPTLPPNFPQPSPAPLEPLPPTPPTPPKPEERTDIPGSIFVDRFEFEGNTAFKAADLSAVTARFTQRSLTFAELLEAESAVTKYYVDAGYINSGAVIEANQVLNPKAAVIKVRIVEGGLEEIKILGTKRLRPGYIRSRIKLGTSQPLNQNRLLKTLQLLQLDPLIQTISADLSAGTRPDQSVLTVKIKEANPFRVDFFANNNRNPSVGSFRRGVRVIHRNLLGFGDGVALDYENSDGSNAFDLSYSVPINPQNGTITLSGGVSSNKIIQAPFDVLDIRGNSYSINLSLRQPLIQTPANEFAVGITASRDESQVKSPFISSDPNLGILPSDISRGADANGFTRTFALRPFQDWTQHSARAVFAVHSQFNIGIDAFGATVNSAPPDSRFFSWRGQAQYVRLLARDTLLFVRSDLQLSPDSLLPTEQFALGGQQSVRGYRQDALLTDNGILTSAEIRFPLLRVDSVKGLLQIAPFVDFGMGWNNGSNLTPDRNTLVGVGLGLQWQMGDRLTTRFDWGIPLIDLKAGKQSLQEQGLYFSLNYSLF